MQLLEQCAGQDVSRLGETSGCSPGAAGAAASVHVVDEHRREIDQHLTPGDDVDSVPDFPLAALVCSAIAPAQSLQALIGVPAGVEVDVLVNRVRAVTIDRTCADEIARKLEPELVTEEAAEAVHQMKRRGACAQPIASTAGYKAWVPRF